MRSINEILADLELRTKRSSKKDYYKPLADKSEREAIHEYYRSTLPELNLECNLVNAANTLISTGYERIVIGDYGAYIEFSSDQAALENFSQKWPGEPKRSVKYIWLETKDNLKTKIYLQRARVSYADYKPGFYYVAPGDIVKV